MQGGMREDERDRTDKKVTDNREKSAGANSRPPHEEEQSSLCVGLLMCERGECRGKKPFRHASLPP